MYRKYKNQFHLTQAVARYYRARSDYETIAEHTKPICLEPIGFLSGEWIALHRGRMKLF